MKLLVHCYLLAIKATPHLLASKLFYEMKWNIVGAFTGVFCMLGIMVSPVFFVFLPVPVIYSQTAIALGTLHSMLTYVGMSRQFFADHLQQEVLKVTMVRLFGYVIVLLIIGLCLLISHGFEDVWLLIMDPVNVFQADAIHLKNGTFPIMGAALGLFVSLSLILEAIMAIPMAAAAYGLGTRSHSFNGIWGLGYKWPSILGCWAPLAILSTVGCLVTPILFFDGSLSEVWVQLLTEQAVQPSAPDNPEGFEGLGWTHPGVLLLVFLGVLGILATPLWASTSVVFFRNRLAEEASDQIQETAVNKTFQIERQNDRRETIRNLRQHRMPSRWKS